MTALNHLTAAGKLYPNAWKQVEELIQDKGRGLPDWPDWCFLPLAGWYSIVSADAGLQRLTPRLIPDVARLGAIGTWRYCQGIYRFDADLLAALTSTELTREIPADVLYRLPEYCIYVETPGMQYTGLKMNGFWCHLESDANDGRTELRLLLDTDTDLLPVPLHLGDWTLLEAIQRADMETIKHNPGLLGMKLHQQERASQLQPLLSLVLYLCSNEPEVDDLRQPGEGPHRPQVIKTRNGFRLFPPDRPRIWTVGAETGAKLREFHRNSSQSEGHSVRPHIRRQHWHGYWTGPKEGNRKFIYHWIPAVLVGVKTVDLSKS